MQYLIFRSVHLKGKEWRAEIEPDLTSRGIGGAWRRLGWIFGIQNTILSLTQRNRRWLFFFGHFVSVCRGLLREREREKFGLEFGRRNWMWFRWEWWWFRGKLVAYLPCVLVFSLFFPWIFGFVNFLFFFRWSGLDLCLFGCSFFFFWCKVWM